MNFFLLIYLNNIQKIYIKIAGIFLDYISKLEFGDRGFYRVPFVEFPTGVRFFSTPRRMFKVNFSCSKTACRGFKSFCPCHRSSVEFIQVLPNLLIFPRKKAFISSQKRD